MFARHSSMLLLTDLRELQMCSKCGPLRKWPYDIVQGDTKKREHLKNPTKIEEIQEKKFIDRN